MRFSTAQRSVIASVLVGHGLSAADALPLADDVADALGATLGRRPIDQPRYTLDLNELHADDEVA